MRQVLSGAAWGRALGLGVQALFDDPAAVAAGTGDTDVRFYAVMGGAAAFSGFMRMPLAMTVPSPASASAPHAPPPPRLREAVLVTSP